MKRDTNEKREEGKREKRLKEKPKEKETREFSRASVSEVHK